MLISSLLKRRASSCPTATIAVIKDAYFHNVMAMVDVVHYHLTVWHQVEDQHEQKRYADVCNKERLNIVHRQRRLASQDFPDYRNLISQQNPGRSSQFHNCSRRWMRIAL